jgi:hypothetical protein
MAWHKLRRCMKIRRVWSHDSPPREADRHRYASPLGSAEVNVSATVGLNRILRPWTSVCGFVMACQV